MLPARFESKNYYEILGVPPDATREEIARTYRDLCRIYHPDSNFYSDIIDTPASPEHVEIFRMLTDAYNTLIDDGSRARYNDQLFYQTHDKLSSLSAIDLVNERAVSPVQDGFANRSTSRSDILRSGPLLRNETHSDTQHKQAESEWADSVLSVSEIIRRRERSALRTFGPIIGGIIFGLAVGVITIMLII